MPQTNGRFAAEKPKKVQNVFIFWSPESTEKREIIQSKEFLEIESSPKKKCANCSHLHTKLEFLKSISQEGGVLNLPLVIWTRNVCVV